MVDITTGSLCISNRFTVGLVQMTSTRNPTQNIEPLVELVHDVADRGAQFVVTPELSDFLEPQPELIHAKAFPEEEHPLLDALAATARIRKVWILIGSMSLRISANGLTNTSVLLNSSGSVVARYNKIHMFDVDVPDGQRYEESAAYMPGANPVVAQLPWGKLGMSVCYDVRFPHLYRKLAQTGAKFLSVPAAFTELTGRAHWHTLLRARAIENGCFVFAAAQCGEHVEGRRTFGHSLVVDPWGEILADGGENPGVVVAEVDPSRVVEVRQMIPSLQHDRAQAWTEPL